MIYRLNVFLLCAVFTVALALTVKLHPYLYGAQPYTDFVAGLLSRDGHSKLQDYRTFWLFTSVFLALAAGLNHLAGRLKERASAFSYLLLYCCIPVFWWLGETLVAATSPQFFLVQLAALLCLLAAGAAYLLKDRQAAYFTRLTGNVMLNVVLAAAALLAVAVYFARFLGMGYGSFAPALPMLFALVCLFTYLAQLMLCRFFREDSAHRILLYVQLLLQLPLPLLFFAVLPPLWNVDGALQRGYPHHALLSGVITSLFIGNALYLAHRWKTLSAAETPHALVPFAISALIVFIKLPHIGAPFLPVDDYHFGETLTAWQQFSAFGQVPYVDMNLVHGFVHFLRGMLAEWFFDGSVASFQPAITLQIAVGIVLFFLSLAWLVGTLPAVLIAVTVPFVNINNTQLFGENYVLCLAAAMLFLLVHPSLIKRPIAWLAVALLAGGAMTLYRSIHGIAMLVAIFPAALWMLQRQYLQHKKSLIYFFSVLGGIAILLLMLTPFFEMLQGMQDYIVSNSRLNQPAWGVSWSEMSTHHNTTRTGHSGILSGAVTWEMLRFSWVGAMLGFLLLCWKLWPSRQAHLLIFSSAVPLYLFVMHAYLLGRLSNGGWVITGKISILIVTIFIPAFWFLYRKGSVLMLPVIAMVAAIYQSPFASVFTPQDSYKRPFETTRITAEQAVFTGSAIGVPKLGTGIAYEPTHLARIQTLKATLDAILKPEETFLDLTSRGTLYFYTERRMPVMESSMNNTYGTEIQRALLRRMPMEAVKAVYADAPIWSHAPVSVRNNLIYRYVALRYVPVVLNGQHFLLHPDILARVQTLSDAGQLSAIFPEAGQYATLYDASYQVTQLQKTPLSWGTSWHSLQHLLEEVRTYPVISGETVLPTGFSGQDAGFAVFDFQCHTGTPGALTVRWESEDTGKHQLSFDGHNGTLVVPLDANIYWLLSEAITRLHIAPAKQADCADYTVSNLRLMQQKVVKQMQLSNS